MKHLIFYCAAVILFASCSHSTESNSRPKQDTLVNSFHSEVIGGPVEMKSTDGGITWSVNALKAQ